MATDHRRVDAQLAQGTMLDESGFLREIVERVLQELLEAEMTEHIGAAPYERTAQGAAQRIQAEDAPHQGRHPESSRSPR